MMIMMVILMILVMIMMAIVNDGDYVRGNDHTGAVLMNIINNNNDDDNDEMIIKIKLMIKLTVADCILPFKVSADISKPTK